jgi:DNA excision repair protein ERCC-4
MNILCTIDSREKERILYAKDFFHNYYPVAVELETGDYMFENLSNDDCVIFEYKTIKDFIGSVSDGRIFEQVKRMNEEFDWSFIVIEGTIDDLHNENRRRMIQKHTGKPFCLNQYYSAIARLNCYTTVMQCNSQAQAFNYMEKQALKIFDTEPLSKHFKKDSDNPAVNYLAGIQGVNYKTAELIISAFNINSLRDLLNIVENEDLTLVKGIGEKKARLIEKNIIM